LQDGTTHRRRGNARVFCDKTGSDVKKAPQVRIGKLPLQYKESRNKRGGGKNVRRGQKKASEDINHLKTWQGEFHPKTLRKEYRKEI